MGKRLSANRISNLYYGMVHRCGSNSFSKSYYRKGIKVKVSKEDFIDWYLKSFDSSLEFPEIDRIDNNGDYELSNMRIIEKSYNVRKDSSKKAIINGITYCSRKSCISILKIDVQMLNKAIEKFGTINLVYLKNPRRFLPLN